MVNYYEILGLKNYAEALEIKTAFRQLAKLYHPDKNPNGKEHFSKVLKAYETLSDPESKLRYDYRLNYEQSQSQQANKTYDKYRNFEEQELKRRRYYEEHIKKYEKRKTHTVVEPEIKESYNEFKYILFATPLAVLLFLLIVNLTSNDRNYNEANILPIKPESALHTVKSTSEEKNIQDEKWLSSFKVFGDEKFDLHSELKFMVENLSQAAVILYLFNEKKEFIRMIRIPNASTFEIKNLPDATFSIQYCSELERKDNADLQDPYKNLLFFKSSELRSPENINPLTLFPKNNKGFVSITKAEFFEYSKK